jgi:AcrR family transcriptional regulator
VSWLAAERAAQAADRILDVAGEVFLAQGVRSADMADIAAQAGCSRATLYRHFPDRHALRAAYMHREARRVAAEVWGKLSPGLGPADRLVATILGAVRIVRQTPVLAAWFTPDASGATAALASESSVIESLSATLFGAGGGADESGVGTDDRGRWFVRVVMSLLAMPGRDEEDEERMVRCFVVPGLVAVPTSEP